MESTSFSRPRLTLIRLLAILTGSVPIARRCNDSPRSCRVDRVSGLPSSFDEASARTWARNNNVVGKPNLLLRYTTQTRVTSSNRSALSCVDQLEVYPWDF